MKVDERRKLVILALQANSFLYDKSSDYAIHYLEVAYTSQNKEQVIKELCHIKTILENYSIFLKITDDVRLMKFYLEYKPNVEISYENRKTK